MQEDRPTEFNRRAGDAAPMRPVLGRRRRFMVNRRYQLRAGMFATLLAFALLLPLNGLLFRSSAKSSALVLDHAPELAAIVNSQERFEQMLILSASVVFLLGVFCVAVLESHKSAGAIHNLSLRMCELQAGNLGTRLRLRKGDHFPELEHAFNNMARALQIRELEDRNVADTLIQMASDLDNRADAIPPQEFSSRLLRLATEIQQAPMIAANQANAEDAASSRNGA